MADQSQAAPVIRGAEERFQVHKQWVDTGRVVIATKVDVAQETVQATLKGDAAEITRVPRDIIVTTIPEIRTEGEITIIPVVEETLFVETRLVLKEEIHVRRRATSEDVSVPVTVRRQRIVVRRERADGSTEEIKDDGY